MGFYDWLANIGLDADLVLAAVVGHHLKAGDEVFAQPLDIFSRSLTLYAGQTEFRAIFDAVSDRLGVRNCTAQAANVWSLNGRAGQSIDSAREAFKHRGFSQPHNSC